MLGGTIARSRWRLCGFIVLMKSLEAVKALDLLKLVSLYHLMVIYQHYCVGMANHKSCSHARYFCHLLPLPDGHRTNG